MHATKKWHCDAVIVQQHFDVLTHILLMSVKSALNHMESLITYRGWRECYKPTQGNREDGDSSKQEDQPYICARGFNVRSSSECNIAPVFPYGSPVGMGMTLPLRTFGCPSRRILWKTWQNFQQRTALLDSGRRLTAAQKVWAPLSWCVPRMHGEEGGEGAVKDHETLMGVQGASEDYDIALIGWTVLCL